MKTALSKALRRLTFRKEVQAIDGAATECKLIANKLELTAASLGTSWPLGRSFAYRDAARCYRKYTGVDWAEPTGMTLTLKGLR